MKVPIRYKSSDCYNAGVDVVYDDESKLQYAPFVYATTASGDNGGSEDEEGEDSMVVRASDNGSNTVLDKNWTEIKEALDSGKFVYIILPTDSDYTEIEYIDNCNMDDGDESNIKYVINARSIAEPSSPKLYKSSTSTGVLTLDSLG